MKNTQCFIILFLCLTVASACSKSGQVAGGAVVGGLIAGAVGGVVVASLINDQPIDFEEIKLEEVLLVEFKDREFIESQISDSNLIRDLVSRMLKSPSAEPVPGDFYRTVELILTDDRVVRIGIFNSYLKNGSRYYQMEKGLNEEIQKHF